MRDIFKINLFVAYQYGVPTKELAGQAMEAEPKSASFTCPGSVSKTFPALISLSKHITEKDYDTILIERTNT